MACSMGTQISVFVHFLHPTCAYLLGAAGAHSNLVLAITRSYFFTPRGAGMSTSYESSSARRPKALSFSPQASYNCDASKGGPQDCASPIQLLSAVGSSMSVWRQTRSRLGHSGRYLHLDDWTRTFCNAGINTDKYSPPTTSKISNWHFHLLALAFTAASLLFIHPCSSLNGNLAPLSGIWDDSGGNSALRACIRRLRSDLGRNAYRAMIRVECGPSRSASTAYILGYRTPLRG